jgi:two-component system LytT family response regulator
MRAFLVDDEPPAIERLHRLLRREGEVEVIGTSTDAIDAVEAIERTAPDLLFLDIHMPELSGFDLLARLTRQPLVIFTTAYDQHALEAFQAHLRLSPEAH